MLVVNDDEGCGEDNAVDVFVGLSTLVIDDEDDDEREVEEVEMDEWEKKWRTPPNCNGRERSANVKRSCGSVDLASVKEFAILKCSRLGAEVLFEFAGAANNDLDWDNRALVNWDMLCKAQEERCRNGVIAPDREDSLCIMQSA